MSKRDYDSTVARIAGNLLSGVGPISDILDQRSVVWAVGMARAIVAEVKRTEPQLPNEGGFVRIEPPNQ